MNFSKLGATVASILLIVAILYPIRENWEKKPEDSFPMSYYPMFTNKRGKAYKMNYLIGLDSLSNRFTIPYKMAGTGGFNQVRRQIKKVAKRKKGRKKLLKKVAKRISRTKEAPYSEIVEVQLVQGVISFERIFEQKEIRADTEKILASQTVNH